MRKNPFIVFFLFLAFLAGCALTPKDMGQSYMFRLSPEKVARQKSSETRLIVALPSAAPELDTYRVALVRDGNVRDYYAGVRWADFLPVLVQDSLVKTLEGAGLFNAVAADQAGLEGGRILKTEIRNFQAEYGAGRSAPVVHIRLMVSVLNRSDRAVLSSFEATAEKEAAGDSLPAIQSAFETAYRVVQRRIVARLAGIN